MIAGFLYVWMIVRRSTAQRHVTAPAPHVRCTRLRSPRAARPKETTRIAVATAMHGSSVLMSQPVEDQPAHPVDEEADRVDLARSCRNQSFSMKSDGRFIVERKKRTKSSGNIPCTASGEPVCDREPGADARERERDVDRQQHEHDRAEHARLDRHAEEQPDDEVDDRADDRDRRAAERRADEHRPAPRRRQRQPVEEALLDVGGELGPGGDRGEQRALHEADDDREVDVAVGREARAAS